MMTYAMPFVFQKTMPVQSVVLFYIAVYQHLRERIRQDIIRTDDPVEAIEEMEVELARINRRANSA